jgi:hypothetical protein
MAGRCAVTQTYNKQSSSVGMHHRYRPSKDLDDSRADDRKDAIGNHR